MVSVDAAPASASAPAPAQAAPVAAGDRFLLIAILATLVLCNVPYGFYALYPFKVFATWLHELSHGLLMLVTGAGFAKMEIFRDTSGLAFPESGVGRFSQAAISSAGYMGTAFFGAAFLVLGRTPRGARRVLLGLGALMALSGALWVRNGFGVAAVTAGAAALLLCAWRLGDGAAGLAVSFLAVQSCINALLDIRVLFSPTMYVNGQAHGQSDAHTVARMLGGPPWAWAAVWLVWSCLLFFAAFRWRRHRDAAP
jgi:hypothetical protein